MIGRNLYLSAAGALIGLTLAAAPARASVAFDGTFGEVATTGTGCDEVFSVTDYHVLAALAGPTGRTIVMRFSNDAAADARGFFHDVNFVGLYGPDGDVDFDRELVVGATHFRVHLAGFVDEQVLYLEGKVSGKKDGVAVCASTATFSAFN